MIAILKTRVILWRKSWISLVFWLFLPIILTIGLLSIANIIQQDTKIPVGIVIEEDTPLVENLVTELKNSPLLRIVETSENEAKRLVENHELDSAFVIRQGYENNTRNGNRNRLLIGYESDLSFAYPVIRETILSLIQKDAGRAKTVEIVHSLASNNEVNWSEAEIIDRVIETEHNQDLLNSNFTFVGENPTEADENNLFFDNPWALWSIFSLLSMLLIFDWLIKEKQSSVISRLTFSRYSTKAYFLLNTLLYLGLFVVIDSITLFIFHQIYHTEISIDWLLYIFNYRLTTLAFTFLLALCFRKVTIYYALSFIIILFITITSGAIIPIEGLTSRFEWIEILNPIRPFLTEKFWSPWLLIFLCFISFWFVKGEKQHA